MALVVSISCLFNKCQDDPIVTGDIKPHQVLLNRVPKQATEDIVKYQILLLRINFGVEITIFTQCDEVLKQ